MNCPGKSILLMLIMLLMDYFTSYQSEQSYSVRWMQNYNYIKSNVLLIIAMPIIIVGFYSPEVLDACDGSLGQVYYPLFFAVP